MRSQFQIKAKRKDKLFERNRMSEKEFIHVFYNNLKAEYFEGMKLISRLIQLWTDLLEELSKIEDAFEADSENRLHGKTILDVGTDCIKPLYIALKYEPDKIIGIDEDLFYSFSSDIEQKSKTFYKNKYPII